MENHWNHTKEWELCLCLINPQLHNHDYYYSPCCWSCQTPCRWGRRCGPPPRSRPGAGQCQSWGHWTTVWTPSWPRPPLSSPQRPPLPRDEHTSPGSHKRLWSTLENGQFFKFKSVKYTFNFYNHSYKVWQNVCNNIIIDGRLNKNCIRFFFWSKLKAFIRAYLLLHFIKSISFPDTRRLFQILCSIDSVTLCNDFPSFFPSSKNKMWSDSNFIDPTNSSCQ